jgi:hypothetical protein
VGLAANDCPSNGSVGFTTGAFATLTATVGDALAYPELAPAVKAAVTVSEPTGKDVVEVVAT